MAMTGVAALAALFIIRFRLPRPYSAKRDVKTKIELLKQLRVSNQKILRNQPDLETSRGKRSEKKEKRRQRKAKD